MVTGEEIRINGRIVFLGDAVVRKISDFDYHNTMQPFEFDLEIPAWA